MIICMFHLLIVINPLAIHAAEPNHSFPAIITFTDEIEPQIIQDVGGTIIDTFNSINAISADVPSSSIEVLNSHPLVEKVEQDLSITLDSQVTDWGMDKIKPENYKATNLTGKGVKIAVLDTGIDTEHKDLKIQNGISFISTEPSYDDLNGHGTHVAGIIAALDNNYGTNGVAPGAEIFAVKVLDKNGEGSHSSIIAGIEWAINNNIDIINMSLGSPNGSSALKSILDKAYSKGILIVGASGNTDSPQLPEKDNVQYPARYSSVIAVGATDIHNKLTSFTMYGVSLEFVAPGDQIYSPYLDNKYIYSSGTSMASPYVAGVLALYKEAYPSKTNVDIRGMLRESAKDLGQTGKDIYYGYGLVQMPIVSEPTSSNTFKDVKATDWFANDVKSLREKHIVNGYPDGTFRPNEYITRAEALSMIGNAIGLTGGTRETSFIDVSPSSFASGYIQSAFEQKIASGFPNGYFYPNAPITRGDAAQFFVRGFQFPPTDEPSFRDVKPEYYGFSGVNSLKKAGVTGGYPDGTYKPNNKITRAELAAFLVRALNI
ncbi:S8 family peptidase [Bacillus suaedaesalsae]|nr:S8 family serine peptidase [Bacillus suaedaesalsae]